MKMRRDLCGDFGVRDIPLPPRQARKISTTASLIACTAGEAQWDTKGLDLEKTGFMIKKVHINISALRQ